MNKQQEELRKKSPVQIKNKKASFEYFFVDEYTAGIVLTGTEIKSIRLGKASLADAYCVIIGGEIWIKGMNVSPYFYGSYSNHEMRRDRKLLLNRREIYHLSEAVKNPGFTIVPTLVFIDKNGRAKVDIALARGKKLFDKRQAMKEKEDRREMRAPELRPFGGRGVGALGIGCAHGASGRYVVFSAGSKIAQSWSVGIGMPKSCIISEIMSQRHTFPTSKGFHHGERA